MTLKADQTRKRILNSARTEFLEKGFSGASLRAIAKNAGVTTGAPYGSFADKDSVFESLVGEYATHFTRVFVDSHRELREVRIE